MGVGENFGQLTGSVNEGCKTRQQYAHGDCYVFTYYAKPGEGNPWAGVYWVFPANNWGSGPGRAVDTSKFQQVRFSAAVEGPAPFTALDGRVGKLSSFAGGVDPNGHFDVIGNTTLPGVSDNVDGIKVGRDFEFGTQVGPELRTFHIPITDFDRTGNCANPKVLCVNGAAGALIGAFGWSIPYPAVTDPSATTPVKIYLDDIVWDTEAPPPE
jgi:hypothetical protein